MFLCCTRQVLSIYYYYLSIMSFTLNLIMLSSRRRGHRRGDHLSWILHCVRQNQKKINMQIVLVQVEVLILVISFVVYFWFIYLEIKLQIACQFKVTKHSAIQLQNTQQCVKKTRHFILPLQFYWPIYSWLKVAIV